MSLFPARLETAAARLLDRCRDAGVMIASAESCTGGLIGAALTEIPGSSDVYERGFITYSNEAKTELVGVDPRLIAAHGAVSAEVARAMAEGALLKSNADLAVSVTGIAGPGGSERKPAGLVHFGVARRGAAVTHRVRRFGDRGRSTVRLESALVAFQLLDEGLDLLVQG
jgi:nicotinamide-nucleotide amidase